MSTFALKSKVKRDYIKLKEDKIMKNVKFIAGALCAALMVSSCNMNKTVAGALIGTGAGAAGGTGLGAAIGALVNGKSGAKKGAIIGAAAGTAVGAVAGTLIGRKMQKAKEAAEKLAAAESITDSNGLPGVKVTFDNAILFAQGKYTLTTSAKNTLKQFANTVLNPYNDTDVAIYGFASSEGEESTNLTLSQNRANAVTTYLKSVMTDKSQIVATTGYGENPNFLVMKNGVEDRAASRRVEVYLIASEEMIKAAETGTLK